MTNELFLMIAQSFATIVYLTLASIFLIPKLSHLSLNFVATILLIPHLFRFIALEIYSALENGNAGGSVEIYTTLIYGDVATAVLAIISVWALKLSWSFTKPIVWTTIIFGVIDQILAAYSVLSTGVGETISDLTWFSFAFFVPLLWVSSVLLIWQLWTRRTETI